MTAFLCYFFTALAIVTLIVHAIAWMILQGAPCIVIGPTGCI